MMPLVRPSIRTTPGFTCGARLDDWPPTRSEGHSSAPCLVQPVVLRRGVLRGQGRACWCFVRCRLFHPDAAAGYSGGGWGSASKAEISVGPMQTAGPT